MDASEKEIFKDLEGQLKCAIEDGNHSKIADIFHGNPHINQLLHFMVPLKGKVGRVERSKYDFLHLVCEKGHANTLLLFLAMDVDVDYITHEGTPLCVACRHGHLEIVRRLLDHGADVTKASPLFGTPLYIATRYGHMDIVDLLFLNYPELIDSQTSKDTMLHAACLNGSLELEQYWIERGADVNGEVFVYTDLTADEPQTPLGAACESGNVELVKHLITEVHAKVTTAVVEAHGEFLTAVMQGYCQVHGNDDVMHTDDNGGHGDGDGDGDGTQGRLVVKWNSLKLHSVSRHWFQGITDTLVVLKLSCHHSSGLESLPNIIPWGLKALEVLDVSHNANLKTLPSAAACDVECERLKVVTASHNALKHVPIDFFQLPSLTKLVLSHNYLTSLEDKSGLTTESGQFEAAGSSNRESVYEDGEWYCPQLTHLDVSHNFLKRLPKSIQSASKLTHLIVAHNRLKKIPKPWSCPLQILKAADNCITNIPNDIGVLWTKTLEILDLSNNALHEIPWGICQLGNLGELLLSRNKIDKFPAPDYWHTGIKLNKLDLSFNKLTNPPDQDSSKTPSPTDSPKRISFPRPRFSRSRGRSSFHVDIDDDEDSEAKEIEFPLQFFSSLDHLMLQDNKLKSVPRTICNMENLLTLDLSNNTDIVTLPVELGNLQRCWSLRLEGLKISNLPLNLQPSEPGGKAADIFAHLKAQHRRSEPFYRMKLMIVGLQNQGKTTLLAALRGLPPPKNVVTNGIVIDKWKLPDQNKTSSLGFHRNKNLGPEIVFSTWDLAGQSEYYVTHQCFLTTNTLYLVVFNATKGEEILKEIEPWLLNIQARAPESHVILVGTHLDILSNDERKKTLEKLHLGIVNMFVKKKGKGFPYIVDVHTVSSTTGEGILDLRKNIYNRACRIQNRHSSEPLIGRKVPRSYLLLQDVILAEVKSRSAKEPPVLTEDEFEELASRVPDSDIDTAEDLQLAANFLHETGQILHFNDHMRDLNTLYFIDPVWLCNLLARIITVRAVHHQVVAGKMKIKKLDWLFHDSQYPKELTEQYLQLLERFEIALTISRTEILIPSMLPKEKPGFSLEPLPVLYRYYKMSYIPSGFWSRLITRLIINVERLVVGSVGPQKRSTSTDTAGPRTGRRQPFSRNCSWNESRKYSSRKGFHLRDKKIIYWREGLIVTHRKGYFIVESSTEPVLINEQIHLLEGIKITVASSTENFSAMGFIVDHLDNLIVEWFPGLEDRDHTGEMMIQRRIPCPYCGDNIEAPLSGPSSGFSSDSFRSASSTQSDFEPREFTLEKCAMVAVRSDEIICDAHPDRPVPLSKLVPDLLLCDLPKKYMVDGHDLVFEAKRDQCLGVGGAAIVFRGRYNDQDIAIKEFHATKNRTFGDIFHDERCNDSGVSTSSSASSSSSSSNLPSVSSTEDCTVRQELIGTAAIRAFKELRTEVSLLCKLHHPCIVQLIGISLRPICFALELAPMGSLNAVLHAKAVKSNYKTRDITKGSVYGTLLNRVITYKIALQVAKALVYLHQNDIIYCDLKSDNVLVWSLDVDAAINAKVSDYGISRIGSLQGVKGSDGTPGFQAPEVRPGMTYNEKADIFSFAMLLYEIVSGLRPFEKMVRTMEITKAIRKGIRPSFKQQDIQTNFPGVEKLMMECWNANHIMRPSAKTIVKKMGTYHFLCHTHTFNVVDVRAMLYTPTNVQGVSSHTVWFWCRDGAERRYSIVDVERGIHRMNDRIHAGSAVACTMKVDNTVWIGGEDGKIEVFGVQGVGFVECLWARKTKAPICAFASQTLKRGSKTEQCVYVAQAKGQMTIYSLSLSELQRRFGEVPNEAQYWQEIKTLCLGLEVDNCRCVLVAQNEQEVWVSCGSVVVVVNALLRLVECKIKHELLQMSPEIRHMQYSSNNAAVWCGSSRPFALVEIDARTKKVTRVLDLSLAAVDAVTLMSVEEFKRRQAADSDDDDDDGDDDDDDHDHDHEDDESELLSASWSASSSVRSPTSQVVTPSAKDQSKFRTFPRSLESGIRQRQSGMSAGARLSRQRRVDDAPTRDPLLHLQSGPRTVTSMLVVKDTLWVGVNSGCLIIICINTKGDHGYQYGQVLAVFPPDNERAYRAGDVHHITQVGTDRVAMFTEYRNVHHHEDVEKSNVSVFERWGSEEFALFDSIHEKLRIAEEKYCAEENEDEET